jgi:hypothetical protein
MVEASVYRCQSIAASPCGTSRKAVAEQAHDLCGDTLTSDPLWRRGA